jgi:hypothetical protein
MVPRDEAIGVPPLPLRQPGHGRSLECLQNLLLKK